jgi:hypothetical protein
MTSRLAASNPPKRSTGQNRPKLVSSWDAFAERIGDFATIQKPKRSQPVEHSLDVPFRGRGETGQDSKVHSGIF